jgi:hypothetical protein
VSVEGGFLFLSNANGAGLRYIRYRGSSSAVVVQGSYGRGLGWLDLGGGRGPELHYVNGASPNGPMMFARSVSDGLVMYAPGTAALLPGVSAAAPATGWGCASDPNARQVYVTDSALGTRPGYIDVFSFSGATNTWVTSPATPSFSLAPGMLAFQIVSRADDDGYALYGINGTHLARYIPATGASQVLVALGGGAGFFGVFFPPADDRLAAATPSSTRTGTPTPTQTPTPSGTGTGTPSQTPTPTASLTNGATPSGTASASWTASGTPSPPPTASATATPSATLPQACWLPQHVIVARADATGVPAGGAAPLFLEAYDPDAAPGQPPAVSLALPTAVRVDPLTGATHYRCVTRAGQGGAESIMTRSLDGTFLVVPCYDADPGATSTVLAAAGTRRVFALVDAACRVDTTTSCADGCASGAGSLRGAAAMSLTSGIITGTNTNAGLRFLRVGGSTSSVVVATAFARGFQWGDLGGGRGPELLYMSAGTLGQGPSSFFKSVADGLTLSNPGVPALLPGIGASGSAVDTGWGIAADPGARQLYIGDSARAAPATCIDR